MGSGQLPNSIEYQVMPLIKIGVSAVRPGIEGAGEGCQREIVGARTSTRAFEQITLVVDSMAIRIRYLCPQSPAEPSSQARFQGYIVGNPSVRQIRVIRVV